MSKRITVESMTDAQRECYDLLCRVFRGKHHAPQRIYACGSGIRCSVYAEARLATFDGDLLTRLVVMAHDSCIRVVLASSGPRMVGIILHKRESREGSISDRHPTIWEAIDTINKRG